MKTKVIALSGSRLTSKPSVIQIAIAGKT